MSPLYCTEYQLLCQLPKNCSPKNVISGQKIQIMQNKSSELMIIPIYVLNLRR